MNKSRHIQLVLFVSLGNILVSGHSVLHIFKFSNIGSSLILLSIAVRVLWVNSLIAYSYSTASAKYILDPWAID
jgi:hypothetical protein